MTDRYFALTVALEADIREDDAEHLLAAILMLRGVRAVEPLVSNPELWTAEQRVRHELGQKLFAALYPKEKP